MTTNLRVQELDFDSIKSNLKEFLRGKSEFSDYDFEGSGMSALMNLLAYNTHYVAVLANMQMGEMWLDTATKRTTAALHASRLGYLPGSVMSPVAYVDLEIFPGDAPATLTIGRGAIFSTNISGQTYQFVTTEARSVARSSAGRYLFSDLPIREGSLKQFRYLNEPLSGTRFVIPSKSVDINTLVVRVQKSESNTTTLVYSRNTSIVDSTSISLVYYVRLNQQGLYEVYFGDNVLSANIESGNVVILDYIESNGDLANGASVFSLDDSVQGYTQSLVTTKLAATGGRLEESVDEIRHNAALATSTQNRAVTSNDYESVIKEIYPVDSVSVWGGDQNLPPVYGKVFIALKPKGSSAVLTTQTKEYIKQELIKKKNVVTVTPVITDPSYVYAAIDSTIYYNDRETNYAASSIELLAKEAIQSYAVANLGKFKNSLRFTKLTKQIDESNTSNISNITSIKLYKEISVGYLTTGGFVVDFGNPLVKSIPDIQNITSDSFYVAGFEYPVMIDDSNGTLRLYYLDGLTKKIYNPNVGTIDYKTGRLTLYKIDTLTDETIKITGIPASDDILSTRENIIIVRNSDIKTTAIAEAADPTLHIFTQRR